MREKAVDIDDYISRSGVEARTGLQQIRAIIRSLAPEATEAISYGIPAFRLNNTYVAYFAAFKNHLSLYPAPVKDPSFQKAFSRYRTSKGTIQFPLSEPVPEKLVLRIIKHLIKQNKLKAKGQRPKAKGQ